MTRCRLLCGLLLASAVLGCFGGWQWWITRCRVSLAGFQQVKEGMMHEEVIRAVGRSPDINTPWVNGLEQWSCDDGSLYVQFDAYGTATRVDVVTISPTLTERIRRWLNFGDSPRRWVYAPVSGCIRSRASEDSEFTEGP
jgi:hypothetical protein